MAPVYHSPARPLGIGGGVMYEKAIVYDRDTHDYALFLDGELTGYARTYADADTTLDALIAELSDPPVDIPNEPPGTPPGGPEPPDDPRAVYLTRAAAARSRLADAPSATAWPVMAGSRIVAYRRHYVDARRAQEAVQP